MLNNIRFDTLADLLKYEPSSPLIFSSGLFLFLFLVFAFFYGFMKRSSVNRVVYVTLFSLFFYYKSSGMYVLLLVFMSVSDFVIGDAIYRARTTVRKKWLVALSLGIDLGLLVYFKYTNLLIDLFNHFRTDPWDFQTIFLPVGISFFTFQSLSYIIDIYRGRIVPLKAWLDYIFYISFFPQLVAGPIVRARDFIPQIHRSPLVVTREMFGEGIFLILIGLFKKAVISDYISVNFVDRIFDAPTLYTGFENLMGVYGYALQIYCDFSGYSDMAIGIALILGFRFNKNFDSPYKSASITEFWRRWHISLSNWLKDYIYISMGGNRKGTARTYFNLIVTMLLGGLWHGASLRFVAWGLLHGSALAVHKATLKFFPGFKPTGAEMSRGRRALGIFFTFHLVCLGWILFRSDTASAAWDMLRQIFTHFHPEVIPQFVTAYAGVFTLIVVGYICHFVPERWSEDFKHRVITSNVYVKAASIAVLIWFIMQIKSADIQPFIYFQF